MPRRDSDKGRPEWVSMIYGIHPVEEALEARRVVRLVTTTSVPREIEKKARALGVQVEHATAKELDAMTQGGVHQGVVAMVEGYPHVRWDEWVKTLTDSDVVLVLDRLTDPRNLGAIARSAYLLGARGIVVPLRGSAPVSAAAMKASAGALQHIPVVRHHNLGRALDELHARGFMVVSAHGEGTPLSEADISLPVALVIGAEDRGIRPSLLERSDVVAAIPMARDRIGSFNASVAASILLYEVHRRIIAG